MGDPETAPLTLSKLEAALHAVDPAAILVPPRILRRVIKRLGQVAGLGLQVPHRKCFVCASAAFTQVVEPTEAPAFPACEMLILLERPSPKRLAARRPEDLRLAYWRLLFHGQVHRALARRRSEGTLTLAVVRQRREQFGADCFDEIRAVLNQERFLLPSADDLDVYLEFLAVYFELRCFTPGLLPLYFPALLAQPSIDDVLKADLNAEALLASSRLPDTPEPGTLEKTDEPDASAVEGNREPEPTSFSTERPELLLQAAQRAAKAGNLVRAIILQARGEAVDPTPLERLVRRLRQALHLDEAEAETWLSALQWLVLPAARGRWTGEGRLLYDLQNVCLDSERQVFAVDLVEWALTRGAKPIQRRLPGQAEVLAVKHLRRAAKRVPALCLSLPRRFALAALLEAALHDAEERLRERFRPLIQTTLDDIGLPPQNFPERVARHKLAEELLDRIVARGFLNLGDLRDALSRNQLKLPDLAGVEELARGDALIRANRRFAETLDGVYRRGESYLRGLQRLSALFFGTQIGRTITRYATLPLGGAFLLLEGVQHLIDPVASLFLHKPAPAAPPAPPVEDAGDPFSDWIDVSGSSTVPETASGIHLLNPFSFLAVSVFLFALLHFPAFREMMRVACVRLGSGLRWFLYDAPRALVGQPIVQAVLTSRTFLVCHQFLIKPALLTLPFAGLLAVLRLGPAGCLVASASWFLLVVVLLNSRLGSDLEESVCDWLMRVWIQLRADLLPGIFWWIMEIFKGALETLEWLLYSVDEWLRFRTGDSRLALFVKPLLGLGWFFLTYVIRIFINLFIEPTVNPIKHFPVVTVAAKLIVPIIPALSKFLPRHFSPIVGHAAGGLLAALVILFLPGVAGFLVWEFKENWKLYRANRPRTLRPVAIGHHGETMLRFLRPGLHSGTIPKTFAKLRKARRRAQRTGNWRGYRKQREALRHVEAALRHFIEREFVFPINRCERWPPPRVAIGAVVLCTNRIDVELSCPARAADPIRLAFRLHDGELFVQVDDEGWLPLLAEEPRAILRLALGGLYALSGSSDSPAIDWRQWVEQWEETAAGARSQFILGCGMVGGSNRSQSSSAGVSNNS